MLYPSRVIAEERMGEAPNGGPLPASDCFLTAIRRLNSFFGEKPTLLILPGGKNTMLLYRDAAYLWQDVAEQVGGFAAWAPMRFYGTTEGRETAELSFHPAQTALTARLRSVSGKPFDHLQGLGLQMEWPDRDTAVWMAELAAAVPTRGSCCAVPSCLRAALTDSGLLVPTQGSLFMYLNWETVPPTARLQALTMSHKAQLWHGFLESGQQPLEFDWLWDAYYAEEPLYLLEWELALRMVLEELGFQVERGDNAFRVVDAGGRERRFDFARGGPAEKVFLKLLFPLDSK